MIVQFFPIKAQGKTQSRMTEATQAIQAILQGNWDKAIALSLLLVEQNPEDVEALNRLAFAYTAIGKITKARETYHKVLELDDCNPIALKKLKKLSDSTSRKESFSTFSINTDMFLEEVGKTKVIALVNTAPPKVLRTLQSGQPLVLHIKRMKIFVLDEHEQFLGMLPDNISKRLIKFINGGNKYSLYVKAIESHTVAIFMKEIKRATRFKNQPSFFFSDAQQTVVVHTKKKPSEPDHDLLDE